MAWIITLNAVHSKIYDYHLNKRSLNLIKELEHPQSRIKSSELVTDHPGSYKTGGSIRGACEWHNDPKKVEIDHFIKSIADELALGKNQHQYDELIIFATPSIVGLLIQHLNKQVSQCIIGRVKKDYVNLDLNELQNYLRENWFDIVDKT